MTPPRQHRKTPGCTTPRRAALARKIAAAMVWLMLPPLLPAALAQEGATPSPTAPAASRRSAGLRASTPVTLNFVNADVEAVSRAMAVMIDRQIIVDPRVKGVITLYSEQAMPVREAYLQYLAGLRGLGFAIVDNAGLLKVVPEADAKLQAGTVAVGPVNQRGDQVITQIFKLNYENPNNLVAVLRPLISPNNTINANPGNSTLIITDYADNLSRIAKIITALDQPAATDVEVVPLQHAIASDLATLVQRLGEANLGASGVPGGVSGVSVLADARSNALIIRAANPARLASTRALIERLDRPGLGGPAGLIHVVYLKNADASKLASVLRAAFGGGTGGGGGGGGSASASPAPLGGGTGTGLGATVAATPISQSAQPSTGGFIQADPATNSLVITAPEPLYRQVRALIDQLDSRRAQVFIESMIVEVSGGDAADFGFQWQGLLGKSGDKTGIVAGTNFTPASGSGNIISVSKAGATSPANIALGEGLNIGLLRSYNGVISLAAIAQALQSQAQTNIISTPTLITLDNEEAKIVVGENVPFITGQFTGTGGTGGTTNPFQTIERKDVGITLRIRPQIGEGGAVRMTIFQEQSSVKDTTAAGTTNAGPSTTKRSIENTVVVDDGAILVLGGLIEDRFVTNKSKVPLLGDIPFLGALFRSESRERKRTNLMVFLRPIVMRDAESSNRLSADRYDQIRAQQLGNQPPPSLLMPINESPVLPARPGKTESLAPPAVGSPTPP